MSRGLGDVYKRQNYIRVEVPHDDALDNRVVPARMGEFNEDGTALLGLLGDAGGR